jgi:hypothetical protein
VLLNLGILGTNQYQIPSDYKMMDKKTTHVLRVRNLMIVGQKVGDSRFYKLP